MNIRRAARLGLISILIIIICTAFVAPIPATSEAEIVRAISSAPTIDGHSPKVGPFEREVSFEYNNTMMQIQYLVKLMLKMDV